MDEFETQQHWLTQAENASEWARMREALDLTTGFALFFAVVPDQVTESLVEGVVKLEAASDNRRVVLADAALSGDDSPVRRFMGIEANERVLLLLRTAQASRRNVESLERCFFQINQRRDQIVARARGPLIVLLRPDTLNRLLDIAGDLYSIHSSQFQFARVSGEPCDPPPWLLLPSEAEHIPHPHLAASALAWQRIHQHNQPQAREALAQAETTGRAWATPFALLRIRLLQIEHGIATGNLLAAAALFDATLERTEQLFGPTHEVTTTVLARGVEIFDRSDRPERAKALANHCWRQLQYTDTVREQTLTTLARFYASEAKHGPATRLQAIRTHWEQFFPDRPWPLAARQAPA